MPLHLKHKHKQELEQQQLFVKLKLKLKSSMSSALGKRKRSSAPNTSRRRADSNNDGEAQADAATLAAFARAFEQKFAPLEPHAKPDGSDLRSDLTSDDSDFGGFDSEEEEDGDDSEADDESDDAAQRAQVQVVTYTDAARTPSHLTKAQQKAFMTSKVPTSTITSTIARQNTKANKGTADDEDDAPAEALNLKNDLALQRLISESHLLDPTATPKRNQRQRVADVRLQALGSRGGILGQASMPMAVRKGIALKRQQREEARRREAREGGVVLEVARTEQTKAQELEKRRRRERGVGGPSVGKFKGGTLQLSRQDVAAIKGRDGQNARGRGKRSRGGSRGRGRGR